MNKKKLPSENAHGSVSFLSWPLLPMGLTLAYLPIAVSQTTCIILHPIQIAVVFSLLFNHLMNICLQIYEVHSYFS